MPRGYSSRLRNARLVGARGARGAEQDSFGNQKDCRTAQLRTAQLRTAQLRTAQLRTAQLRTATASSAPPCLPYLVWRTRSRGALRLRRAASKPTEAIDKVAPRPIAASAKPGPSPGAV